MEAEKKIYTMEDAVELTSDVSILSLPRRVYCDSETTLKYIANLFAQCHIGTAINWKELFIQA